MFEALFKLFDALRYYLDRLSCACHDLACFFDKKSKPQLFREKLDEVTDSLDSFKEEPLELVQTIPQESKKFSDAAYYYFILKQLSALWESESQGLPLQVFNELRNATDHFFRSLVDFGLGHEEEAQLRKARDHLQRAIFDVSKLLCAFYNESLSRRTTAVGERALGLVDQGEFLKELTKKQHVAHSAYIDARQADLKICAEVKASDVVEKYLLSVLAHKYCNDYYDENLWKIRWARVRRWRTAAVSVVATIFVTMFLEVSASLLSGYLAPYLRTIFGLEN